ncbi:MAG: hypothetical protein A2086_06720 [Spirochaetes bacterium GWD1_27_9]|nr:MAG: hypothetical protein A2Y34_10215 [Spirochaetes bacterium GWC1_27_15]OHD41332.1 MAG: hypothetical protein A2086_06720 [Spirochaetes bacterium GWD1_27_9]
MANNFFLINLALRKSRQFFFVFFYFKIFLLLFYFIGNYQSFSIETVNLILKLIAINDSFVLFFSIMNIISSFINYKTIIKRIILLLLSFFSIIFAIITIFISLFITVFSNS